MAKLNESSTIPITWVAGILVVFASILITGSFWVSGVNNRLSRIETALGLPAADSKEVFQTASASEIPKKRIVKKGKFYGPDTD